MTDFIVPDQKERTAAASELDKNAVVLAGAGTGKTHLLIDRLTALILEKEMPVEKIVALTFTKKAAEELRVRLEDRLRAMDDNPLAAKALEDIPKAQIGTIHSFAGHLLRLYPLQAHVDPAFKEDEGDAAEEIFESEWKEWIKTELADQAPRAMAWHDALQSLTLKDIKELADAIVSPDIPLEDLLTRIDLTPEQNKIDEKTRLKIDEVLIEKAVHLIRPFVERVRAALREHGVITFQGLLVFARDLVRDHADVRAQLQRQYLTFLVDEFQDTDPLQGELLFYLAEQPGRGAKIWTDVQLEPGRLFVVGDPKQSIYRFRGADIAAFDAFRRHMTKQGALELTLSANFRSGPAVLSAVNSIFSRVMLEKPGLQPPYAALESANINGKNGAVEMLVIDHESEESEPGAEELREKEAEAIADLIRSQNIPYRNVALLFRSANAFPPYLDALKRFGIPYLAEGEKFFYQTREVTEFLNILSAIADPSDQISLVGVLRTAFGAMTDPEILTLREKDGFDYRIPPSIFRERLSPLYQFLNDFHRASLTQPVGRLITDLFQHSWILELMAQSGHGEQALANLAKVERLAHEWSEREPLTLSAFVKKFKKHRRDEREESENPLADAGVDAVKVMTIHKAKGLEFPVVILPNLSAERRNASSKDTVRRVWGLNAVGLRLGSGGATNAAMIHLENLIREREIAEELRVFYVAATRAKEKMILVVRTPAPSNSTVSELLKQAQAFPKNGESALTLSGSAVTLNRIRWSDAAPLNQHTVTSQTLSSSWDPKKLAERLNEREEIYDRFKMARPILSPSSLLHESEKEFATTDRDETRRELAINIGLICHKVLEEWDFLAPVKNSTTRLNVALTRAAKFLELPDDAPQTDQTLTSARSILQGFMTSAVFKKIAGAKIIGREIPFLYPLAQKHEEDPTAMRGVIDLLYEKDGKLIVADYKTTTVGKQAMKTVASRYKKQGAAYQEAVNKTIKRKAKFEVIFLKEGKSVLL